MQRREAPGVCEAPWGLPCDRETQRAADFAAVSPQVRPVVRMGLRSPSRGARAPSGGGAEAPPETPRAPPRGGGVATPATETLRLPTLHRPTAVSRFRPPESTGLISGPASRPAP